MVSSLIAALVAFSAAFAANPHGLVTNRAGILALLKQRELWEKPEILWIDVDLAAGKTTRAYFSKLACGRGVCPQYIFVETRHDRWRLIGTLPAQLERADELKNGYRVLRTTSFVGEPDADGIKQTFEFNGAEYVINDVGDAFAPRDEPFHRRVRQDQL